MNPSVATGVEELKRQFIESSFTLREDNQGGVYVVIDNFPLGARFQPVPNWLGFHISAQYPYADIYPVFIGHDVKRVDGVPFTAPVTAGHNFEGRPALQISRRSGTAANGLQKATAKILKILAFLGNMP
jgi:hypothetical protein